MSIRAEEIAWNRGYRVSEDGVTVTAPSGRIRKLQPSPTGYLTFSISVDPRSANTYPVRVHRLQAFQKFGFVLYSVECVRHLDGNLLNNSEANIDVGSQSCNMMDIPKAERLRKARIAAKAATKYKHADVIAFHRKCRSYRKTMREFGIPSKGTVSYIVRKSETARGVIIPTLP